MNRVQVSPELRNALRAKAEECEKALSGAREELETQPTPDTSVPVGQRQLAAEKFELYSRTLRQVEAALGRVDNGSYGICLRCEEAIGQKRLDALPWAPFCVECQQGAEMLQDRVRIWRGEAMHAA